MEKLIENVLSTIREVGGEWGVVLEDLNSGDRWEHNSESLFYSASVIKLPIMAAVFSESNIGNVDLNRTISLRSEDIVGGSGILQHMTPNTKLTIYDIITLMIIQSDNTATNILIELVGIEKISQIMQEIGMQKSTFYHKLMINNEDCKGKNEITSHDMAVFLKGLYKGEIVSAQASKQMVDIMKRQQIRDCLAGKLPYQELDDVEEKSIWKLANKTGWVPGIRHDVGIFYLNNKSISASLLSRGADDLESRQALADIGESIYRFLKD